MTKLITRLPKKDEYVPGPIVAIGNFDGVHKGHATVISRVVQRAREVQGTSLVLTFEPHPVAVLRPEASLPLLTTLEQRVEVMTALGVDLVVALPFTMDFARRTAEEFVREDLVNGLGAREIYVGRNFAFGKAREGHAEDLKRLGESLGMRVVIQDPVLMRDTMVSSSTIRELLGDGRVAEAAELLGRPYTTDGIVAHGEGRGRSLGYPTANIQPGTQMVPKVGIYAAVVDDRTSGEHGLDAAVYIGSQPTFGPHRVQIEVHVLRGDVLRYEHRLQVKFIEWIRGEERFESPEALTTQIARDIDRAKSVLGVMGDDSTQRRYDA